MAERSLNKYREKLTRRPDPVWTLVGDLYETLQEALSDVRERPEKDERERL